ncbi:MAG: amino acid ABC transporter permease [Alphaproteobacteria bacterium]|nr:amino acid ABC transporter permease [Alphaproteobacteria bacterium]
MSYQWRFDVAVDNLPVLLEGLGHTLLLTALAMAIGLVVGLALALMRLSGWRALALPAYLLVETFRTTPLLVQIIWVYSVLPLTVGLTLSPFFSGLVALGLNVAAFMSEIYRAGITSVSATQTHAALALGMTRSQVLRRIVLPQALLRMVPPMAATWVSLFKDTSVLAVIGVAEMMTQARIIASDTYRPLEIYTLVAVVYFVITYPQSLGVDRLFARNRVKE